MKKFTFILFLVFGLNLVVLAHTGNVKGVITDSSTTKPIPLTNVLILKTGIGTAVDEKGHYRLDNVPEGIYQIQFSHMGYGTVVKTIKIVADQEIILDIKLRQVILNLSNISVTSELNPDEAFTSISRIDVQLRPIISSQDLLRTVPGLFITQHGGGGKAEQIFLRGFDNDHGTDIDISVDGIPVNMVSHAHGQGYADLHYVIPETIEKMDFNKGPYYANHGDFCTSGFVDFSTKTRIAENMIKLEMGSYDTWRTVALINVIGDEDIDQNLYLAGEFFYTKSYFDLPQDFTRTNLFAKYSGRVAGKNQLNLSASTFSTQWDQSGQIPDRAVTQYHWINRFGAIDDTEGGNSSRSNLNAQLTSPITENSYLKNQIYFTDYSFNLWSNFTFWLNDSINGDQIQQQENRKIYGYRGSYTRSDSLSNLDLKSEFGIAIRRDDIPRILLFNNFQRNVTVDTLAYGKTNQTNYSLYYSGTFRFSDNFSMNLGLRFDYLFLKYVDNTKSVYTAISENASILNPKVNLFYNFNKDFQIYLKGGTGFHSNDARSIYERQTRQLLPRAIGADLGTFFKPYENTIVHLAIWGLYLEEELVYVGDEAIVEPSDETKRLGFDVSVRYQFFRDWFFDLDFNYARGRFINEPEGANYIPLAPIITSQGGLTYKPVRGVNLSLRYRYVSDRPANEENTVTALGSFITDIAIAYRFDSVELFLRSENMFNEEWNEAQFDTESRLRAPDENGNFIGPLEANSVSELNYTPGSPRFFRGGLIFHL